MPSWGWALAGLVGGVGLLVVFLPWLPRPFLRAVLAPRYGFRLIGQEHLPAAGPLLLASNHVTWIDGFLLVAILPRRLKVLVNAAFIDLPVIRTLAHRAGLIPVPFKGPRAQRAAIQSVQLALDRGEAVLIFPEAQLTRNGLLGPFYRGLEVMLHDREAVPVIPVFLDHLWGSIFSYSGGRFFWKCPKGFRRRVIVALGSPVTPPRNSFQVRQAVLEAGVLAATAPRSAQVLETIDLRLPHWRHPVLGLLAVSTPNFDKAGIRQQGHKVGSVGLAAPGIALRAVQEDNEPLPADTDGRLQARLPHTPWLDTGHRGRIDRDGFVFLSESPPSDLSRESQETMDYT